jgi:hypothetical protein
MIQLCSNPECDDDAGVSLQRQIDVAPVPYCLQHAGEREAEFRLKLENFQRTVIATLEPSPLELAEKRLAELEAAKDESTTHAQLVKALETLETQAKAMASLRNELGESQQAFQVAQRELERVKRERDRINGDLNMATQALEQLRKAPPPAPATTGSEPPPPPMTPAPATRPDGQKP